MSEYDDIFKSVASGVIGGKEAPAANSYDSIMSGIMSPQTPSTPARQGGANAGWDAAAPSAISRFGQGLKDPINGGAQLLTNLLPQSFVKAGDRLNNFIADTTGLVGRLPEGGVNQQVQQDEKTYQSARGADAGFDFARMGGNILSPANIALGAVAPVTKGMTLLGRAGVGAGMGAATAAITPTTGDDFWHEKGTQAGIGAAFGGALPIVGAGIGRLISPNASRNPNVDLLKAEGVRPTLGQTLGGAANALEEKAMSIPIMGDAIAAARGRAREDFNQAAINRAVAPIGGKVTKSGQDGIQEAGNLLSKSYNDAISKVGSVAFDKQFVSDVSQLRQMAQNLSPEAARHFNNTVSEVLTNRITPNGSMLGSTFKTVDSRLGKLAGDFSGSSDAYQKELGNAYSQLQSLLKQQAQRSNPGFAEAVKRTDAGWANLVRIEQAGKAALNTEGVFTPAQLNAAVRMADQSTRGRAVARGTALMQDLGNAGQQVLGNKIPNSGTADRLMLAGGAGGLGLINPAIPLGLLGGAAAYSSPVQSALRNMVSARPQNAQAVRDSLLGTIPGLTPAVAQMGLGLLN